jgi:preprotein translocase subunit YajC
LLPFILLIAVFYFMIIRPQRKRDKQTREMLANLKVGDNITTIGGICGKIVRIRDDVLTIEVGADKVKLGDREVGCTKRRSTHLSRLNYWKWAVV